MSDFFMDPSAIEINQDIEDKKELSPIASIQTHSPYTIPSKMKLKKIMKKGKLTFYKVSASSSPDSEDTKPASDRINVSDLLSGNDVDVAIEPDTEGNVVYVTLCSCGNNITFCKIM